MAEKFGIKLGIDSEQYKKNLSQTKSKTEASVNSMQKVANQLAEAIVDSMSKFVDQFKKVQDESKKTGKRLQDSTGQALDKLSKSAKSAGKSTGSFVQKMSGDLDAVIAAFDKLGSVADGALDKIVSASPLASASMSMVQFQIEMIAKEFGDALAPQIQDTADKFERLRKFVEKLPDPVKKFIAQGVALVATLTTIASMLSVVTIALSTLSAPIVGLVVAIGILAVAWRKNIGGIQQKTQTVVAKLVELFYVLINQFNIVKQSFMANNTQMMISANKFLITLITIFTETFVGILNLVQNVATVIATVLASNMGLITETATVSLNALLNLFNAVFFAINKIVGDNSQQMQSTFASLLEAFIQIGSVLAKFYAKIINILASEIETFAGDNSEQIGRIISKFQELVEILTPIVKKVVKLLTKILAPAFKVFVGIVSDVLEGLLTTIEGIFDVIIGLLTGDMDRVESGIKGMVTGLLNVFIAPINGMIDALNLVFDKIKNWKVVPDKIADVIPSIPNIPEFEEGGYIAREMIARLHPGEVVLTAEQVQNIGGKEEALSLGKQDFSAFDNLLSGMNPSRGNRTVTNKRQTSKVVNYVTIANARFNDETDMRKFRKILERSSFDDLRGDTITNTRG